MDTSKVNPVDLYSKIEPFNTGYLNVSHGHKIYFEECGNPKGFPVLYVHGGPGVGCDENDRRFFDPEKWHVILFDQRGSNRSIPFGCIENNTTADLAKDMWWLRRKLKINKFVLFGGSWGTFLSLFYSILNPKDVAGMILRGIYLGEKEEMDFFYGGGVKRFFPEQWKRFAQNVPPERQNNILGYFYERMTTGTPEQRNQFAYELSRFEEDMLHLEPQPASKVDTETKNCPYAALGLLEAHYFINDCFVEEGYVLNNIKHIPKIPITIVQGQYDMICPPLAAYRLKGALEQTGHDIDWNLVLAGHSKSDKAIQEKLLSQTNAMYNKI